MSREDILDAAVMTIMFSRHHITASAIARAFATGDTSAYTIDQCRRFLELVRAKYRDLSLTLKDA